MMVKDYDTCTDEELIARLRAGEREITAVSYTHLTLPTTSRRQRQMCIRDRCGPGRGRCTWWAEITRI